MSNDLDGENGEIICKNLVNNDQPTDFNRL